MNYINPGSIEKGIHLLSLSGSEPLDGYERLYIGDDFCERLTPEASEIEKIIEYARCNNKKLTLLTAYYTDKGLDRLKIILDKLNSCRFNIEVTVNDLGALKVLNNCFPNLMPVFGRLFLFLLHPFFRAPVFSHTKSKLREAYHKRFALAKDFFEFLHESNIKRAEFDNIHSAALFSKFFVKEGIAVSLYYPFTYLTTSRRCLFSGRNAFSSKFALLGCKKECLDYKLVLQNKEIGQKIFVKGNAQFIYNKINKDISMMCKEWGIDRVIKFSI